MTLVETSLKELIVSAKLRPLSAVREVSGVALWDIIKEAIGPLDGSAARLPKLLQTSPVPRFMEILECFTPLIWDTLTKEEVRTGL